jgi:hypothetical protein
MTDLDQTQRHEPVGAGDATTADLQPPDPGAPTTPVAVGSGRPGRSRTRWLVAGVATVLVAVGVGAGTLLLTGQSSDPDVLAWTPADRVSYVELRLDLPGGQQAELAEVLSAFPGFDDQAAFPAKISEALDRLVSEASEGTYDYRTDIDPWFAGRVSFSSGPTPAPSGSEVSLAVSALVLIGVDDAAAATAWVAEVLAEGGATTTTETHAGVTITVIDDAEPQTDDVPMDVPELGYAIVGSTLAYGDLDSIKAAIDTKGETGILTNAQFKQAKAAFTGDRIAFFYADAAAAFSALDAVPADLDPDGMTGAVVDLMRSVTPAWTAGAMRAIDGSFVLETRSPRVAAFPAATARASAIADLVPSDTLLLLTAHDIGSGLDTLRDLLATKPQLADAVEQVDQALALVGGFEAATGWIGDVGIAIEPDGDGVVGGLVITPTDPADARQLFTTLTAFLELGAGDMDVEVREETYAGAEITILDLGPLEELTGGASAGVLPPLGGDAELALTVTDEVVVIGFGSSFVRDVLDAREGPSLADDARFTALLERVGAQHGQLSWMDVAAMRTLIEGIIPASERAEYDAEIRPYLTPFDAIISVSVPGDTLDSGSAIITFRK